MQEIHDHGELAAACAYDPLCRWAAQGLDGRSRAWRSDDGTAVAVAGAGLSRADRLVVHGAPGAAIPLVREVLAAVGPRYRPLGERGLMGTVIAAVPELRPRGDFGWMDGTGPLPAPGREPGGRRVRWLATAELPEVAALLADAFPDSYAQPGAPGVERWAGVRDRHGRLAAVAALAWSAPTVGLLAGVAVAPAARGRGLGRAVCAFVLDAAFAEYGTAALMVDDWNRTARRLYTRLGLRYRPLRAATQRDDPAGDRPPVPVRQGG